MKKLILALTTAATLAAPAMVSSADAQGWRRYNHDWGRVRTYDYNSYEPGYNAYYADRYYRPGQTYVLTRNDRIYRGHDGRYYCRRHDGSTGLILGAALGGLLGNQVGRGDSRAISTIVGAGAGAALGSSIDRGRVRCR
jgi:hypothetical protein